MSKIRSSRSVLTGIAALAIVVAAWILTSLDSVQAKAGQPGVKNVNVVDSVELDVNVVGAVEQDVRVVDSVDVGVNLLGSSLTHAGQNVHRHVTLVDASDPGAAGCDGTGTFRDRKLLRVFPDGTTDTDTFEVPSGQLLVITDVTWRTSGSTTFSTPLLPGQTLSLGLNVGGIGVIRADETIDTNSGRPGAGVHLQSGVVAGPGAALCPTAGEVSPSGFAAVRLQDVYINGYLIDAN